MNGLPSPPELVVMLTYEDKTVGEALDVFRSCRQLGVRHWGFKDIGVDANTMMRLADEIKSGGGTVYCEIVSLSEPEALRAAELAGTSGVDVVMGSVFSGVTRDAIHDQGMSYFPFAGRVSGHPSVLSGTVDEIVSETQELHRLGVDGIDLLSYRYVGSGETLLHAVAKATPMPVISAGSIESYSRIETVWDAGVWGFTIGSAFFDRVFVPDGSFSDNVANVLSWLSEERTRRSNML